MEANARVAVLAAEAAGVCRRRLVSRAGLAGGSLLLLVVRAVPLGLLGATVQGVPPGIPRLREAFPGLRVDSSTLHVSFAGV